MIRRLMPFADCRDTPLRWVAIAVAIAAATAPGQGHAGPPRDAPAAPVIAAEIRMDHISVEVRGEGSPVILIPGLSSPRAVWDGVAPGLAAKHRVFLVQVNGFGGDDPGKNGAAGVTEGVLADLSALIAKDRLDRPAIVGHSYGGLLAMQFALRHPEQVGRVLVVDALPFIGTIMGARDVAAIRANAEQARAMTAATYRGPGAAAPTPLTKDPGGIWSITPEGRIQVANWSQRADPRVVAGALYDDMTTDLRTEVARIAARPFTVLYAAGMGEAAAASIWEPAYAGSGAKLVAVPGSYHFIMLDQPARFAKELDAFLAE